MTKEDLGKLKKEVQHHDQGFEYAYGPLNKSNETRLFKQLVEDIITDRQNVLNGSTVAKPKVETKVQEGVMYAIRNGEEININKLLKNVNLNHVRLSENALHGYEALYENDPKLQSTVPSRDQFDEKLSKSDIHQQVSLGKLTC